MMRNATKIPMKKDQTVKEGALGFPGFGVVVLRVGPAELVGIDDSFVEGLLVPFVVNVIFVFSSYCSSIVIIPSDASVLLLLIVSLDKSSSVEFKLLSLAKVVENVARIAIQNKTRNLMTFWEFSDVEMKNEPDSRDLGRARKQGVQIKDRINHFSLYLVRKRRGREGDLLRYERGK